MGFFRGRGGFFEPLADPLCGDAEKWFSLIQRDYPKGSTALKNLGCGFFLGSTYRFRVVIFDPWPSAHQGQYPSLQREHSVGTDLED